MTTLKKNLTGKEFGHWTVLEEAPRSSSGKRVWVCVCSCGKKSLVEQGNLTTGKSSKCISCAAKISQTKHGMGTESSGLYSIWKSMKSRCYNPNRNSYARYGARGISVCDSWMTFEDFLADMGATYQTGLTLDRIDNDKGYSPENCRWANIQQQNSNTSKNVSLEFKGSFYTEAELSRLTGVPRTTLQARRRRGLTGDQIVYGTR